MHLFGSRTRPLGILPVVLQLLRSMASSVFVMLTAPSAKHSGSRSGPCRHLSLIWPSARRSDPPSSCKTLGEQWMELQSQQFVTYKGELSTDPKCQMQAARPEAQCIFPFVYTAQYISFVRLQPQFCSGLFFLMGRISSSIITCCVPLCDTRFPGAAAPLSQCNSRTLSLLLWCASVLRCFSASPNPAPASSLRPSPRASILLRPSSICNTAFPCSSRARFSRLQPHDFGRACRNSATRRGRRGYAGSDGCFVNCLRAS